MRILYSIVLLLLISCSMFSQGETPKVSGELKLKDYKFPTIEDAPKIELPKATIGYKSILTKKEDIYLKKFTFKKEEKVAPIIVEKEKGYDFDEDRKDKLNIKLDSEFKGSEVDVSYGKYIIETKRAKILFRDFGEEDGDLVRFTLDNTVLLNSVYLSNYTKEYFVDLSLGENLLEFLALNEGLYSPNTATFSVIDDNGKIILSSEWYLNTGVSANFILFYKLPSKEKTFEELEEENKKLKEKEKK